MRPRCHEGKLTEFFFQPQGHAATMLKLRKDTLPLMQQFPIMALDNNCSKHLSTALQNVKFRVKSKKTRPGSVYSLEAFRSAYDLDPHPHSDLLRSTQSKFPCEFPSKYPKKKSQKIVVCGIFLIFNSKEKLLSTILSPEAPSPLDDTVYPLNQVLDFIIANIYLLLPAIFETFFGSIIPL